MMCHNWADNSLDAPERPAKLTIMLLLYTVQPGRKQKMMPHQMGDTQLSMRLLLPNCWRAEQNMPQQ